MKKLTEKKRKSLLFIIFISAALFIVFASFTMAKYTQTEKPGTFSLEILNNAPVLYRDFVNVELSDGKSIKADTNIIRIVFDRWDNQKTKLNLKDSDW